MPIGSIRKQLPLALLFGSHEGSKVGQGASKRVKRRPCIERLYQNVSFTLQPSQVHRCGRTSPTSHRYLRDPCDRRQRSACTVGATDRDL